MFDKKDSDRLRAWVAFRNTLETSDDPVQDTINLYKKAPLVNRQVDPYDQDTWLDPWQLLNENKYCDFSLLLGIFYTLHLTAKFSETPAEIHICKDTENSLEIYYLLFIGDIVVGYDYDKAINSKDLPKTLSTEIKYTLN